MAPTHLVDGGELSAGCECVVYCRGMGIPAGNARVFPGVWVWVQHFQPVTNPYPCSIPVYPSLSKY